MKLCCLSCYAKALDIFAIKVANPKAHNQWAFEWLDYVAAKHAQAV